MIDRKIFAYNSICQWGNFMLSRASEFLDSDRLYDVFIRHQIASLSRFAEVKGRELASFVEGSVGENIAYIQVAPLGAFKQAIRTAVMVGEC
jgi:hypothetical protein